MWRLLVRYVKFMGSGLVGTVVDMTVLWILSDYVFSSYMGVYVVSPVISFQISLIVNYLISYYYVWKDRTRAVSETRRRRFLKLFIAYDFAGSAVFLLRLGALLLIERLTGWDVILCNIIGMCVSGVVNFIVNNQLIFKKKAI